MTKLDLEPVDLSNKMLMEVDNQSEQPVVFSSFDLMQHLRVSFKEPFERKAQENSSDARLFDGIRSVVFLPKGTFLGSYHIAMDSESTVPTAASISEKILSLIGHVKNDEQQNIIVLRAYGQTHYQTCRDIQPFHDLLLQGPVAQMLEPNILFSATEQQMTQRETMSCSYCQIQFDDRQNMQTHQSSCNKVRDWQGGNTSLSLNSRHGQKGQDCTNGCRECAGGDFKSTAALQSHLKCVHANNMILHVCKECTKGFATAAGLRQHLNEHAPIPKLFNCETCRKGFSQFSNLCRHKRTHVNCRQPLKCQHCQQRFSTINALAKHRKQFRVKNSINSNSVTTDTVDDQQNRTNMIQESNMQVDAAYETRHSSSSISIVKGSWVPSIYETPWITASQCPSSTSGPKVMPFDENFSESKLYGGSGVTFFSSQKLSDGTDVSPQSAISARDMESSSSHSSPKADDQNSSEEKQKDSNDESHCHNDMSSGDGCRKTMEPPRLESGEPNSSDTGIGTRTDSGTGVATSQGDCKSRTMDTGDMKFQMMQKPRDAIPTIAVTSIDDSSTGASSDNFYRKQSKLGETKRHYTRANTGALDLSWQSQVGDTTSFTAPTSRKRPQMHDAAVIRPASSPSIDNSAHLSIEIESLSKKVESLASINASDCQSDSPPRKSKCEAHYSLSIQNHVSKFNIEQILKNQVRSFNTSMYFTNPRQLNQADRIHFDQPGTHCYPQSSHQNHNVFNLSTNQILTRERPESWRHQVAPCSYNRNAPPTAFPFINTHSSWAETSMPSDSSGFNDHMPTSSQAILTKSSEIKNRRQHICNFCGKIFHRAANLNRHVRIHTGEQPYVCNTCARPFSISSNLQRHVRTMHNDQTFTGDDVTVNPTVGGKHLTSNTDTSL